LAQEEVTQEGVALRFVQPRIKVKSYVRACTPEAKFQRLFELARTVAEKGDVSWSAFSRSKSLYRLGLTTEQHRRLKFLFVEQAFLKESKTSCQTEQDQLFSAPERVDAVSVSDKEESSSMPEDQPSK